MDLLGIIITAFNIRVKVAVMSWKSKGSRAQLDTVWSTVSGRLMSAVDGASLLLQVEMSPFNTIR